MAISRAQRRKPRRARASRVPGPKLTPRGQALQKKYGITEEQWEKMNKVHGGRCWICGRTPKNNKRLNTDHSHQTGRVRGLLCYLCNRRLIGRWRDDQAGLFSEAGEYLASSFDGRKI